MKLKLKLVTRLVALLVLAVLVSLLLELPIFWRQFYPLRYKKYIEEQAEANNLDTALVAAVIKVESNFQPKAVSRVGARGLMQLRPGTAKEMALGLGHTVDDDFNDKLFDPEYNITLGTRYLAHMLRQYNGNEILALAAYNAGPSKLRTWLEEGTWDGTWKNRRQIPYAETRNYLDKVQNAKKRYSRLYNND